jgi:large subunit ribosomal protein L13
MIIDANNTILGRLASFAAKNALLGEKIDIINCEKAIITGKRETTLALYKKRMQRGSMIKGPFTVRRPHFFVKRAIRGMLPYKKENGKKAFKRIKCYVGAPENLKEKPQALKNADVSKLHIVKYVTVKEICNLLGGK